MTVFRFAVVTLLIASAVNLSLMVPGGFVETRDFSAYPAIVLGAFNVLLTVLGLGSLVLAVIVARKGSGGMACRSVPVSLLSASIYSISAVFFR